MKRKRTTVGSISVPRIPWHEGPHVWHKEFENYKPIDLSKYRMKRQKPSPPDAAA